MNFLPSLLESNLSWKMQLLFLQKASYQPGFEFFTNARQFAVWVGLQVNFKYHEEIGDFCKNGRLGLEPAISRMGSQVL